MGFRSFGLRPPQLMKLAETYRSRIPLTSQIVSRCDQKPVSRPVGQPVSQSVSWSVDVLLNESVSQSNNASRLAGSCAVGSWSICPSASQSAAELIRGPSGLVGQAGSRPYDQCASFTISLSVNDSNCSLKRTNVNNSQTHSLTFAGRSISKITIRTLAVVRTICINTICFL